LRKRATRAALVVAAALALGDNYVYYPAAFHSTGGKDFGNAVLARGPIEDDRKIILQHLSRFRRMQRVAVAATVALRGERIRVYSVHLATQADLGSSDRCDQVETILRDARDWGGPAIVAGDFNDRDTVADNGGASDHLPVWAELLPAGAR
jgi:endonuclease/exonuclease/phosphatase family metal-dependent hydrolase